MVITQTERNIVHEVLAAHFPMRNGTLRDELESAGHLGLAQAAERFSTVSGVPFRAFAWRRVKGAMQDALRAEDHLTRTERKRVQAGERDPGPTVLTGVDDEMYLMADPADEYALVDLRDALEGAIKALPARQRFVIRAVYYGDWTGREVAEVFSVDETRVSQLHTQALKSLRAALNGSYAAFMDPLAA